MLARFHSPAYMRSTAPLSLAVLCSQAARALGVLARKGKDDAIWLMVVPIADAQERIAAQERRAARHRQTLTARACAGDGTRRQ